jgi:hypothetical protein
MTTKRSTHWIKLPMMNVYVWILRVILTKEKILSFSNYNGRICNFLQKCTAQVKALGQHINMPRHTGCGTLTKRHKDFPSNFVKYSPSPKTFQRKLKACLLIRPIQLHCVTLSVLYYEMFSLNSRKFGFTIDWLGRDLFACQYKMLSLPTE